MFKDTYQRHTFFFFAGIFLTIITFLVIVVFSVLYFLFLASPSQFTPGAFFVAPGQSLVTVAENLEKSHFVRSKIALQEIVVLMGKGRSVDSGEYLFDKNGNVFTVAYRITTGDFRMAQPKVTIPEGSTNEQVAELIKKTFSDFDVNTFLRWLLTSKVIFFLIHTIS